MKALNTQDDEFALPLTPLLDVVFLLLVFFLVSTTFVNPERSILVKLPVADQAAPSPKDLNLIFVTVREGGAVIIGGRSIVGRHDEEVRQALQKEYKEKPGAPVIVRGDRNALHNDIVRIMNAARAVGISELSIATFETEEQVTGDRREDSAAEDAEGRRGP